MCRRRSTGTEMLRYYKAPVDGTDARVKPHVHAPCGWTGRAATSCMRRPGHNGARNRCRSCCSCTAPAAPLPGRSAKPAGTSPPTNAASCWCCPKANAPTPTQPPGFLKNPQVWNDGSPQLYLGGPDVDDVRLHRRPAGRACRAAFPSIRSASTLPAFPTARAWPFAWVRSCPSASRRWPRLPATAGLPSRAPLCRCRRSTSSVRKTRLIPLEGGEVLSPWSNLPTYKPPVRETLEKWAKALGCAVEKVTRARIRMACNACTTSRRRALS